MADYLSPYTGAQIDDVVGKVLGIDPASLDSDDKVTESQASAKIVSLTAGRTLLLTDAGRCLEVDSATDVNITIPPQSSVAFTDDTEIELIQFGAGQITVVAGSGVTLHSFLDSYVSAGQYAVLALKRLSSDVWILTGGTA